MHAVITACVHVLRLCPQRLYEHDLPSMQDGTYDPVLSKSTVTCMQSLPWFAKLSANGRASPYTVSSSFASLIGSTSRKLIKRRA